MTKEKLKELLNELAEREFTIEEIAELFGDIMCYQHAKEESENKEENENYREFHSMNLPIYRKWLQDTLCNMSLDYTIEDF